ncbi:MAG TPA: UDP-N-acetylmuramoyl-L-alanine--D-glutamate ligase [Acidimicrobiia bacterium]
MGHVVVLGLGVTGDAVARYARAAGDRVTVLEDEPRADAAYRARADAAAALGAEVLEAPAPSVVAEVAPGADLLVPSPGVPARHAAIAAAQAAGVPVRAEIDLAAEAAGDTPLVAITGTNGKTTVTTLVTAMLTASGVDARAAGNIGTALLDAAGEPADVLVAEVSSFQLAFTTPAFRPRVAVLLNLADDHLDWHGSQAAYAAAKARVFAHQGGGDLLVFNADDAQVTALAATAPARRVGFSLRPGHTLGYRVGAGGLVAPGGGDIAPLETVGDAPHERANALAAVAAALDVGATPEGVRDALRGFNGLPHRLAPVGEAGGVRYYDDSKATNPHATVTAVTATTVPVVLVAGGRNKGLDLSVLRRLAEHLRAVVAIGEAASEIEAAFSGVVPVAVATRMRDAVERASALAEPGDVVILSPACASLDWYPNYAARGDDFAAEVARLVGGRPAGASHAGVPE